MSESQVTKEQIEQVQAFMQGTRLVMAYCNRFGEDAVQLAKGYLSRAGMMLGENLKPSLDIVGSDASAVAAALGAFLKPREPQTWLRYGVIR